MSDKRMFILARSSIWLGFLFIGVAILGNLSHAMSQLRILMPIGFYGSVSFLFLGFIFDYYDTRNLNSPLRREQAGGVLMETTFDKFIKNNPEENEKFRIEYASFLESESLDEATNAVFNAAFDPETYRDPRSAEYKSGVKAGIKYRLLKLKGSENFEILKCPYPPGSAQADAWYSGCQEGNRLGLDAFMKERKPDGK